MCSTTGNNTQKKKELVVFAVFVASTTTKNFQLCIHTYAYDRQISQKLIAAAFGKAGRTHITLNSSVEAVTTKNTDVLIVYDGYIVSIR